MIHAWRSFLRLMEGSRRLVLASATISLLQALLLVPIAFVVQDAFDETIPAGDSGKLVLQGVAILGLFLVSSGLALANRSLSLKATKEAMRRLITRVLARLFALPRSYLDRHDLGTLHATIVQDSERLDVMANALVAVLIPMGIVGLTLGVTLVVISPLLAAVLLASVPLMIVAGRRTIPRIRSLTRDWQRASDVFSSETQVGLRSITLIKLHGAERSELERRAPQLAAVAETGRKMAWWHTLYSTQHNSIAAVAAVIVLVVGGIAVSEGTMTLGDLISFYAVLGLLRNTVLTGSVSIPQVISGRESLSRLEAILDEEAVEPYNGRRVIHFGGAVALDRVSFSYRANRPVLREATLEVAPGETVLLVGPNGAGKTTVLRLIAGLYAPDAGEVRAEGVPLAELDLTALRRRMGVVVQDPLILPATVRENIAFGRPDASDEQIARAAELSGAAGFIEELDGSYDALVGDDGVLLSGGQRQRIAVARALLGEPMLLMLDEPTTHLDREGAAELIDRLTDGADHPAILVVSHDPTVAASADRVYELAAGRLVRADRPLRSDRVEIPAAPRSEPG